MNNQPNRFECPALSRRRFLSGCAACAVAGLAAPAAVGGCGKTEKMAAKKIHVIYSLHDVVQPRPDWPNIGYDFKPVMERVNNLLKKEIPEFEFVFSMAAGPEEAEKILLNDQNAAIDGYLVYQMNCWNKVVQPIAAAGKPVLYADYQFAGSGGFLVYTARFLRGNAGNVGFVASSDPDDLIEAVKCFARINSPQEFAQAVAKLRVRNTRKPGDLSVLEDELDTLSPRDCLAAMKESKILAVKDQNGGPADPIMNIPMEMVSFAEVNAAWEEADQEEARAIAQKWQEKAGKIIDVSFETLQNSAAFYLGMKKVLADHHANAITINCLGGFYGGHIHAYPCLGFHELNNQGLVGGCECDTRSAATMVAFTAMTKGRPGYISDPVLDTAKRQIIYAHCVASSKVFGPDGPENSFDIMTHSEDRQGASVRSILPTGYLTTTLEIKPDAEEILLHQAKAVDNDPEDRACRTKLCAEPIGDFEKLFTMWGDWGWHRVTFYGDLKEPAYALANEMGWKVIEEA